MSNGVTAEIDNSLLWRKLAPASWCLPCTHTVLNMRAPVIQWSGTARNHGNVTASLALDVEY